MSLVKIVTKSKRNYLKNYLKGERESVGKLIKSKKEIFTKLVPYERASKEIEILERLELQGIPFLIEYEMMEWGIEMKFAKISAQPFSELEIEANKGRKLFEQCVYILMELHKQNILHRDISPSNILVDSIYRSYIIDFGCAIYKEDVARATEIIGTIKYASPEAVFNPRGYSESSDFFALARVFMEKLEARNDFMDFDFIECLDKCLNINPEKRFKDANEILQFLNR